MDPNIASYSLKKDELVVYTASFNPTSMSLKQNKPGQVRLNLKLGDQVIIQIFPERLSFHWIGKYPGWKVFRTEFKQFFKQLSEILHDILLLQVGLRFINKLTQKTCEQNVGFWLKSSPNFPAKLCSVKNDYFFRCKWPLEIERWVQVSVAEAEISANFRPLMLDIDVIQQLKKLSNLSLVFSILQMIFTKKFMKFLKTQYLPIIKKY